MHRVVLESPADLAGWRREARRLAAAGVPPEAVEWTVAGEPAGLPLEAATAPGAAEPAPAAALTVPRAFLELAGMAVLHSDPRRFALLYRLLWRLQRRRGLLEDLADPDVARLAALARAVRRDIHKMHAFVRFRALELEGAEHFVAWYEPDHHILAAAAPFFVERFANLAWTILTPAGTADWDGESLRFGPGATLGQAPGEAPGRAPGEDALKALWRSYYASTFNPARANPKAMRAEMPARFWRNLPEAAEIAPLLRGAAGRVAAMVERPPLPPVVRRGAEVGAAPAAPPEGGLARARAAAAGCRASPLWQPATQTVFGEGPPGARLMLVGEQPGDVEDLQGRPFVGPAGQLLDRALAEAGIDRAAAYVTNAVKHFKYVPRGKRRIHQKPGSLEIQACAPWLEQELALVDPRRVVALGATAAQALFGRAMPIGRSRGRLMALGERQALVTVHPSYLLRLPDAAAREREYRAFVADLRLAAG
ncbi:MAG: UdgX family uracil-DNA binding protein [Dongiaceae bacterium]